ncbi:tetratricopeptide repeat protein, partial [Pontimicrobium sp. MEBiC01747]
MTIKNLQSTDTIKLLLEDAYYERTSNIENSIKTANRALKMSKALGNNVYIGKSLNQLALYHMIISDFEQSKNYSKEAISYFSPINDEQGIADANYSIGSIHYKTNNYHVGLKYLLESLRIYRKYNDFPSQSKVEKAIGTIYEYMGDHDNAFKSYKSSIKIARKIPDLNLETNVCNNLSGLLLKKKRPKYAMQVIEHSIKSKKLTNDIRGLGFAIYGRGKVFFAIQEYEKAKADFLTAINIHKDTIENLGASMGLHKLGVLYYKLGRLEEAIDVLEESLQLSLKYNISMIKIKNYHILYLIYKQNGNTEKALKYLEIYLSEKEAVINTQTLKVMEDYDLINKMNKLENEAELQRVKQKNIDKKNRAEKRSVALKQQFLSIMSHEIRTPLNAITTIVSILEKKVKGENKELLDSLQFASNNLINIVNDILDFTKLDSRKAKLELDNSNLYKLCNKIANLHLNVAQSKGLDIVLENNISENQNYLIDETKMTQILSNLINNAIKFTDKGGVTISAELIEEQESYDVIKLSVKDTGEGILEKDITEIFESFSQVKPIMTRKQGGTGLGLAIVKRLVKLHGSQIKVKSKEH